MESTTKRGIRAKKLPELGSDLREILTLARAWRQLPIGKKRERKQEEGNNKNKYEEL